MFVCAGEIDPVTTEKSAAHVLITSTCLSSDLQFDKQLFKKCYNDVRSTWVSNVAKRDKFECSQDTENNARTPVVVKQHCSLDQFRRLSQGGRVAGQFPDVAPPPMLMRLLLLFLFLQPFPVSAVVGREIVANQFRIGAIIPTLTTARTRWKFARELVGLFAFIT